MRGKWLAGVALVAAVLAVPAAPAAADDAALWNAYSAGNPEIDAAGRAWTRALEQWERSRGRRWRPVVKTSLRLDQLAAGVESQVAAQQPSSSTGEKVKQLALLELEEIRRGYRLTAAAARDAARGRRRAISEGKRADRAFARAVRYGRRVERAFKALGFSA